MFNSAAVAVTPSKILSSAAVAVTPSRILSSAPVAVSAVAPSVNVPDTVKPATRSCTCKGRRCFICFRIYSSLYSSKLSIKLATTDNLSTITRRQRIFRSKISTFCIVCNGSILLNVNKRICLHFYNKPQVFHLALSAQ
jgi:hypothetical protein